MFFSVNAVFWTSPSSRGSPVERPTPWWFRPLRFLQYCSWFGSLSALAMGGTFVHKSCVFFFEGVEKENGETPPVILLGKTKKPTASNQRTKLDSKGCDPSFCRMRIKQSKKNSSNKRT